MLNPASSSAMYGRSAASLPCTSTAQRQEITPAQATTNIERAIRRFNEELKTLKGQDSYSDHGSVACSSMLPAQKFSSSSEELSENEQYAKALLVAVREEIYKKGYKSPNKLRPCPPGKDKNQWDKVEHERCTKAWAELARIRTTLPPKTATFYFVELQKRIQNTIEAKGHHCGDLSYAGIGILDEAGIKDTHVVSFDDFDHNVILIGKMPPKGLPLEMEDWPSHLAICDPWANIACPAKEFISAFMEKMQKWDSNGKKIRDSNKKVWTNPVYPDLEKELRGHRRVSALIVGHEVTDKNGRTPLMLASQTGKVDDMQILLKAGVSLEARDHLGWTALMHAAFQGNAKTMEILLNQGADIEAKDNNGYTALMHAARQGKTKTVEALLNHGANIEAKDNNETTPLIAAVKTSNIEMISVLIKAGANIEVKDNAGKNANDYAVELATAGNNKVLLALTKGTIQEPKKANSWFFGFR